MDILGILKNGFVTSRLFENSDGSVLSSHSLLLAQHLTNTGQSVSSIHIVKITERNLKSYLKTYGLYNHDKRENK